MDQVRLFHDEKLSFKMQLLTYREVMDSILAPRPMEGLEAMLVLRD